MSKLHFADNVPSIPSQLQPPKMVKKRGRAISLSLDWDTMVREGEDSDKVKAPLASTVAFDKQTIEFCTGSSYTGKWDTLGMTCYGNYVYPHRCEYEGGFKDGMFHGEGTLLFPMGQKLEAVWHKGTMVNYKFFNVDGLEYEQDWSYCQMPDRRFLVSLREGLQPAGREFMTNQQPQRPIEPNCYDTGDGFYDIGTRSILTARDVGDVRDLESVATEEKSVQDPECGEEDFWINKITIVSDERHNWIVNNCRKAWDEPAGYRPDLYENWITGRKTELEELDKKYYGSQVSSEMSSHERVVHKPSDAGQEENQLDVSYSLE